MKNGILYRKLYRDLWSRKGSLLTLAAIIAIGVGVYVGMAAVFRDMDGARDDYYSDYRLADFSVEMKRAPEWAVDDIAALPNVSEVRGRVDVAALLDLPGRADPVSGRAISMPRSRVPVLDDILLRSGTWFSETGDREVILSHEFARENNLVPGSRIGVHLRDELHNLLVVGTAMSPEFVYLIPPGGALVPDPANYGVLFLPERFLQESCDLDGAYNQVIGLARNTEKTVLADTLDLIEARLDPYGVTNATPAEDQPSVRFLADELTGIEVTATVVPAIFLGVAALVLNVMLGRLVAQQRTTIGTLKAVGFSSGAVIRHYLAYGITIGFLGGIAGILLGLWLQRAMLAMYRNFFSLPSIEPHLYPWVLLFGLGVSVFFAAAGTFRGARYAAGLEPAEAMRPPPPEKGGKVLPEFIPPLWRALSFRSKMILRAVFRNPFRSGVSILASAISTSIVVSVLSQVDSLDYLMHYEFARVAHEDLTVTLRDPRGRRAAPEVAGMPAVSETEPQLAVICDLSNGAARKRTGVTALPPYGDLYTPLDRAGKPITVPESGLVLSKKLAELLQVQEGDTLSLRPLIGERVEVPAPVVGIVDTFLGLPAYADIRYLSRLIGEEWSANVVLATLFPGSDIDPLYRDLKESPEVVGVGERERSLRRMQESFGETMGTSIAIMVFFAGVIAFGSVLNAALVSLSERRREVGTLRVLGYTPAQVARIFSGESFLLNGIGVLLGLAGGIGLAHLISLAYNTEMYRFPAIVYPRRLLDAALIMGAFILAAQALIYRMIRRFDWLEVLKTRE